MEALGLAVNAIKDPRAPQPVPLGQNHLAALRPPAVPGRGGGAPARRGGQCECACEPGSLKPACVCGSFLPKCVWSWSWIFSRLSYQSGGRWTQTQSS